MTAPRRALRRRVADRAAAILLATSAGVTCALLVAILLAIVVEGVGSVGLEFLMTEMRSAGTEGGILYQLLGTLILVLTAAVVSTPLALGLALTQTEYLGSRTAKRVLAHFLYTLNGVPSIIFGLFGFFLFVKGLGWGKSWLAGGVILGIMIVPTVAVATQEAISAIAKSERDAAVALGFNRSKVIWALVVPRSLRGLVTGTLLGLARAAGETAPILFTAAVFTGARWPSGVRENPVLALPYHILNLAQDSFRAEAVRNAWGTALVLVALSIGLITVAIPLRLRLYEEARG